MTLDEHSGLIEPASCLAEPLTIVQLHDVIDMYGGNEDLVQAQLAKFSCFRNEDVEAFLRHTALLFEKTHKSRTYLAVEAHTLAGESTDIDVIGYFSLSLKSLELSDTISNSKQKQLHGLSVPQGNVVVGYLIGQLGKNDTFTKGRIGPQLIDAAVGILQEQAQRVVGGRFAIIECTPHPMLLKFYAENGFSPLQEDPEDGMAQLVCQIS